MKSSISKLSLLTLACFSFASLEAVEERDWINDWPIVEIPGAEELPIISVDDLENYSISVTYALDGGRFGDQLTNYLKALWVSWKYNAPLIFRPFEHSDELVLSDFHAVSLTEEVIRSFSGKVELLLFLDMQKTSRVFQYLKKTAGRQNHENRRLLWSIGLLTPFDEEHFCEKMDEEEFRDLLQKVVKPKRELTLTPVPKDYRTVALHVRTGVGYDLEINIRNMPTKFPPDTFYLNGLRQVAARYKGEPLYVYIFTDHPEPGLIQKRFYKELKNWGIENEVILECRLEGNKHTENVLEDLFSMMRFDCLIHPDSSLSRLVAIISAPSLEVKPSHWAEHRKDPDGKPIRDRLGNLIVDSLVIERAEKGKPITKMSLAPIEPSMLFD